MNDLILKYQFTDRGGRRVYHIRDFTDRKIGPIMGEVRMIVGKDIEEIDFWLDWCEEQSMCIEKDGTG